MAPILTRRGVIAVNVEATPGTDPIDDPAVSTGAFLAYDVAMKPLDGAGKFARKPLGKGLLNLVSIPGIRIGKCSFTLYAHGTAAPAGVEPIYAAALKGVGFNPSPTIVAGTSVTYDQVSGAAAKNVTIRHWRDGKFYKLTGCMGTMTWTFNNGEPVAMKFDFMGRYVRPIDAALVTPAFTDIIPPPFLDADLTFQGVTPICAAVSLDLGNNVVPRPDVTEPGGVIAFHITDRTPSGTIAPEETLAASKDWWADWENTTTNAMNIGWGSAVANTMDIDIARTSVGEIDMDDSDGITRANINFTPSSALSGSAEDDIKFKIS